MRQLISGLLIALFAPVFSVSQAAGQTTAQPQKNVYVVTYIDIIPTPAGMGDVDRLLLKFAADSRRDPGVIRFEVLVQDGRPNHFTIVEMWRSRAAFEAHTAAAHTREYRQKIQSALGSPYDERLQALLQ